MAFEHICYAFECDMDISMSAALMLYIIAHQIGKNECCWPSYETLGKKLRRTARTAYNACQELVEAGLLYIESGKERGGSNCFYMHVPEDFHLKFVAKYKKTYPKGIDQNWEKVRDLVYKSRLINKVGSPFPTPVGSPLQTGVGKNAAKVGKKGAGGMKPVSDNQDNRTRKIEEQDMFLAPAPAHATPPENAYLPPIDSTLFRKRVSEICYELGAPESVTLRIYEHNRITKWAILKTKTLPFALKCAVWYWMKRDPKLFQSEKIRDFIAKHPELVNSAKPEIP